MHNGFQKYNLNNSVLIQKEGSQQNRETFQVIFIDFIMLIHFSLVRRIEKYLKNLMHSFFVK